jgi:hypothetical protein
MASPFTSQVFGHYEHDVGEILGFVALDGASNVVGYAPTTPGAAVATTSYTRIKGAQKAIGPAGGVLLQPHTATGTYLFTLDEPWIALLAPWAQLIDQGAVGSLTPYFDANVTNQTSGIGALPGNNSALGVATIRLRWRNNAGTLTDPVASTGFWVGFTLQRSAIT